MTVDAPEAALGAETMRERLAPFAVETFERIPNHEAMKRLAHSPLLSGHDVELLVDGEGGTIVYERYKTVRPDDTHIWCSVSKVTGETMLAFLEHEGKVDVGKPVSHCLPELKGSVWDTVKVEGTLDMATGINGTEHDEAQQSSRTDPDQNPVPLGGDRRGGHRRRRQEARRHLVRRPAGHGAEDPRP